MFGLTVFYCIVFVINIILIFFQVVRNQSTKTQLMVTQWTLMSIAFE